jgi:hypothetical protein
MFTLPNQLQASLDALKANTVTFSGTAKFPNGDPAIGSLVYMTAGTSSKLFKPPKGITRVDNDGKFKITLLKSDLTNLPKKKFNELRVFAVSSENPSKTWSKKVAPGVKYDVDFTYGGSQEIAGVTVTTTNKGKNDCEARGGKYVPPVRNAKKEIVTPAKCILPAKPKPQPEESWWDKNKLWVYIGGGLCLVAITTAIIVYSQKNKKGKK